MTNQSLSVDTYCKNCNKKFHIYLYRLKIGRGKFCSRKCHRLAPSRKIIVNCFLCKKELKVFPSAIKNNRKFCSTKCHDKWRSKNMRGENSYSWTGGGVSRNCFTCNKEFKAYLANIKIGRGKFCSKKCYSLWQEENQTGNRSHFWKGGVTPMSVSIRRSAQNRNWAKSVKERDNFICQVCQQRGGSLRSNHIKKFSDYPELRFILTNGITICENCDLNFVLHHEENCEDFFNFNLIERGYLND